MAKAKGSSTESDIRTAVSSESIDQTYASMDQTCHTEGLMTCTSEVNLRTANDGIRTAAGPEDVRTCHSTDSLDTCRGEEELRTAAADLRTAISNSNPAIEGSEIRTAVGSDEDVRTCRRVEDLRTCHSGENLKTATGDGALRTAVSCSALSTAVENADIQIRTAVSNPALGTAVEAMHTGRLRDSLETCRLSDSLETCRSRTNNNTRTALSALRTAASLPAIVTALGPNEFEVRTAVGSEVDVRTCLYQTDTAVSATNLNTAVDSSLRAVRSSTRSKSTEQLATALNDAFALRTAIERCRSDESVRTAGLLQSCSTEDILTALDYNELDSMDEKKDPPSLYCMDGPKPIEKGAASATVASTSSQYRLTDLHNYIGYTDPATAYQIKVQETIAPKLTNSIVAAKSEYVLPGMPGSSA